VSDSVIRVQNLGKKYRLRHQEVATPYRTLRDVLAGGLRTIANRIRGHHRSLTTSYEEFWALKDLEFEVRQGEVLGIIGRNGAGKSTLLKVLSRITEPTVGRVTLNGRIASLLEVGTGFHPELTGRENIFLNGSILGMRKAEVTRKFDDIVEFAGVEKFLDTPVKRYSSGMYVRLAFAVAAHLEPEVLIIDEVLAVGDAQFQKKCLGKMGEVAKSGRTVLFVSHNMQAVTRLCMRAILLDGGRLVSEGPVDRVVQAYLRGKGSSPSLRTWPIGRGPGNDVARLCSVRVKDGAGNTIHVADIRRRVGIEMEYVVLGEGWQLIPNFHFVNADGLCVFIAGDLAEYDRPPKPAGRYFATMWIPENYLAEGTLSVTTALSTIEPNIVVHFQEADAVAFEVVDTIDGNSARGRYTGPYPGIVRPVFDWDCEPVKNEEPAGMNR
jgi:lipopolysaccharide transport system ATP-binding protein